MSSNKMFRDSIKNPSKEGLYFKLIITSAYSTKDYFCLVEGKTDVIFYSSIRHSFFARNRIEYLFSEHRNQNSVAIVGKESVINTCSLLISKNPSLINRCVFIVDHDDFGLKNYLEKYSENVLKKISLLPVYSFENYFFRFHNFKKVILPLFDPECRKAFEERFNDYKECAIRYFSLKRVITATYQFNTLCKLKNFRVKYNEDEIFCFLPSEEFINLEKLNYEVDNMRAAIVDSKPHNKLYKESLVLLESNIDFIKGKILFGFFAAFYKEMMQKDTKDIKIYSEIVKKLNVDLDIVL